jgi:hypothetical protein
MSNQINFFFSDEFFNFSPPDFSCPDLPELPIPVRAEQSAFTRP